MLEVGFPATQEFLGVSVWYSEIIRVLLVFVRCVNYSLNDRQFKFSNHSEQY